jgi:hypothetical protein
LLSERELLESDGKKKKKRCVFITKSFVGWEPCFEHKLRGQVTKVSNRKGSSLKDTWHFAVLYHQVVNDNSFHFVRLYYTVNQAFEYKDIKLPGTIWVDSISLEKDSLIFSR